MIEINGVMYTRRLVKKTLKPILAIRQAAIEAGVLAYEQITYGIKKPKHVDCNIVEEFELIQQKKSKLSRRDRDWVEYTFHKHFIKVEPATPI